MKNIWLGSNLVSKMRSELERKFRKSWSDEIARSFGELRGDAKERKKRKNVRISADLLADEADVRFCFPFHQGSS